MNRSRENFSSIINCDYPVFTDKEALVVNRDFNRTLRRAGLLSFDDIWNYPGGELIKVKNNRSVSTMELADPSTGHPEDATPAGLRLYLKRHSEPLSWLHDAAGSLKPKNRKGEGLEEFETYCDFRKRGLATAVPVAGGTKKVSSTLRSFLITLDFSPLFSLEEIILKQPDQLKTAANEQRRKNILAAIARYARHMHESGINQKDFNATHILMDDLDSPVPAIVLFDLQHVDRKISSRFRWPVKALAELNFSLPESIFSEQDRIYLFHIYKKTTSLDFLGRMQYKWMVKKTERIRKHTFKNNLAPKTDL